MKGRSTVQTERNFWDCPDKVPLEERPSLFHHRLFNRFKSQGANTSNASAGDPAFNAYEPVTEAATRVLHNTEALRRYHNSVPSSALTRKIVPFFEDLKIDAPNGLKPSNIAIGFGVTNLYAVMIKKLKEDYAEKYPKKKPVILIPTPTYGIYTTQPLANEVEIKTIPLSSDNGWSITPAAVRHAIDDVERKGDKKVIAYYNANPHNPTGRIYTRAELEPICEVLKKKDIFVIDDLIYHGTELTNKKKICPVASLPGMFDHSITLYGLGKAFGAADLRAGVACGRKEDVSYIHDFNFKHFISVPVLIQEAVAAALASDHYHKRAREDYWARNAEEYHLRYNLMKSMIEGVGKVSFVGNEKEIITELVRKSSNLKGREADDLLKQGIPGLSIKRDPEAGYFALVDFSEAKGKFHGPTRIDTMTKLAAHLVDSAKLLVLPAPMMLCGPDDEMSARCSFGMGRAQVVKSVMRMKKALEELTEKPTPGPPLEMQIGPRKRDMD
ncbi:MAG: pyridoxal phosphate-dependent aminotransferase [Proteobacteria bacterium]|nr:pyridoxal phosphate-dependent aminotransferase [Pseudomonadota bacterium]